MYLDTPTWADLTPRTAWAGIAGGERVMHVEYVADPTWTAREIRVTPEQYRRLWASVRASFALDRKGRPRKIDHPGYGPADAFYDGAGRASAVANLQPVARRRGCAWRGSRRRCGARSSQGLVWRYRKADQRT